MSGVLRVEIIKRLKKYKGIEVFVVCVNKNVNTVKYTVLCKIYSLPFESR